jgi:hypothetical protein
MGGVKSLTDLYAALRSPVSVMATLMQGTRRATATDVQLCHNAPGAPTRVTLYGSTIRHVAQDLYYPIGKYLLVASFWRGNCRVCRCRKAGYGSEPNAVTPPSFCGPRCIYSNHGRPAVSASRSRYKSVADAIASLATHHHPIPAIPRDDYWHETCNTLQPVPPCNSPWRGDCRASPVPHADSVLDPRSSPRRHIWACRACQYSPVCKEEEER